MEAEVSLEVAGIPIHGRSGAGQESYYRLPTLRAALDAGRCPQSLVSAPNIFVTHGHLDHAAGVATYASQRTLAAMADGAVFVPAEVAADFAQLLEIHRRLEGVDRYAVALTAVAPGDRIALRSNLVVRAYRSPHRVPCIGFTFLEKKRKLKREFKNLPGGEIARLRRGGTEVAQVSESALLSYPGDCSREIFESAPEIFNARVLLLECTFLRAGDEDRAERYGHLHLRDIVERADDFQNEWIVLTHFSGRYSPGEIRDHLAAGLPARLRPRVIPFL